MHLQVKAEAMAGKIVTKVLASISVIGPPRRSSVVM